MKKVILLLLILITALGAGIRLYKLGEAPKGLYIDEAGQGYAAYSILQTGKDEFGKDFPIVFRNFTDFKTPVYIYLVVPLIPLFDLTVFTVRFPSFLFSVLTFPLIFFLVKMLILMKETSFNEKEASYFSLLVTLLLTISPWHVLFGRTNFECNVALFFYLLGVYLFYIALRKPWMLVLSSIVLAIALPAYHSERILVPLTFLVLGIRYRKKLFSKLYIKYLLVGGVFAFIITIPTLMVSFTPGFLARASGLNIFSHSRQMPAGFIENYHGVFEGVVNSSLFLSTKEFLALYISYFSPREMFYLGDYGPRSSFPDLSTFFVWQFIFYLIGFYFLVKNRRLGELRFFVILLLAIAPIPAAVTRDPYTTIRALPLVVPQTILIALGIVQIFSLILNSKFLISNQFLNKSILKFGLMSVFMIIVFHSILNLYSSVIVLNEYYRAKEWDYGLEEVAEFLKDKYQILPVIVDSTRDEYYIQLLFFLKYPPERYQAENYEVPLDEYYTNMSRNNERKIGQIITRAINWEKDLRKDQYLVGDELAISYQQIKEHNLILEKEVFYPDKSVAFRIVRTNPEYEKARHQNSP